MSFASRASIIEIVLCALLLALAGWILFGGLGDAAFHDGDEALYAAVAVEMASGGSWLTPFYWDAPLFNKPPLPYWFMALSCRMLPEPVEFQTRFPSALAALLLAALVYWFTRTLAGPLAAAAAVLLLLTNMQLLFEHGARSACFDAPVVLLSFAALAAGAWAHRRLVATVASAIALAGVVMVKGPIVVFPFVSVLTYLIVVDRRAALRWLAWSAVSFVVLALPWHVYQLSVNGRAFWDTYVLYEMFGRSGTTESLFLSAPFIHLDAAWQSFLPWSPLLAVAIAASALGWPAGRARGHGPIGRLLAAYILLIMLALCFMRSKWPWYVLPAYPAVVVTGAVFLSNVLRTRWRWTVALALGLTAGLWVLLFDVAPSYDPTSRGGHLWPLRDAMFARLDSSPGVVWSAVGSAALLAGCLVLWPRYRRSSRAQQVTAAVLVAVVMVASIRSVARVPKQRENATRRLTAVLAANQVDTIFLIGFRHQPRYGYRVEPLSGFYLLQTGAHLIDCKDLQCIAPSPHGRSALVVDLRAMTPQLESVLRDRIAQVDSSDMQAWLVNPESSAGFREF